MVEDERPYLNVNILGKCILELLDSEASRTVIGNKGLGVIEELGLCILM